MFLRVVICGHVTCSGVRIFLVSSIIVPDEIFCLSAFLCFSLQYKCACVLCFHPDAIRVSLFYLLTHSILSVVKKHSLFLVFIITQASVCKYTETSCACRTECAQTRKCACKSDVCLCVFGEMLVEVFIFL